MKEILELVSQANVYMSTNYSKAHFSHLLVRDIALYVVRLLRVSNVAMATMIQSRPHSSHTLPDIRRHQLERGNRLLQLGTLPSSECEWDSDRFDQLSKTLTLTGNFTDQSI